MWQNTRGWLGNWRDQKIFLDTRSISIDTSNMSATEYRKAVMEAALVTYWDRKTATKKVGLYDCLKQLDSKLELTPEDKQPLYMMYKRHTALLATIISVSPHLQNKAKNEHDNFKTNSASPTVQQFWAAKEKGAQWKQCVDEYKFTIDRHVRREKTYLSSQHLRQLKDEDASKDDGDDDAGSDDNGDNVTEGKGEEFEDNEDSIMATSNEAPDHASELDNNTEFVERNEPENLGRTKRWILSSGTDVGQVLTTYRCNIPELQMCLNPVYWGILDLTGAHLETKELFSTADWNEMLKSFEDDVKMVQGETSNEVCLLFDEISEIARSRKDVVTAIDEITPQKIEAKHNITLSPQGKSCMVAVKRAVLTYAENLADIGDIVSESDFDNSFTNMLTKRFLDRTELRMDTGEICSWASAHRRNEGRSVTLRARVGQKCDFRGTFKHSINKLEAIIGLRSGGLPVAHQKKKIYRFCRPVHHNERRSPCILRFECKCFK
ncbi:hypothetical protein BC938DRAFT_476337 [Jimgerdemannia flammicorona]|uniref:Uncharacterized protein n=1 Tax=Jimgerdemannia flammicorona TaxID=994334 RepID=A0A433QQM9_9FUNG|nr:hypothetical protein BC938DRAFT_476337 [Jimgerdemannia flammicorona]